MTDHERPAEITNRVLSEGVPYYSQRGNGNGEHQLIDNAHATERYIPSCTLFVRRSFETRAKFREWGIARRSR